MSTKIWMALVLNLLHLLFSVALVRSDQSSVPLISFKVENVTYDCIDIYKQPGLDHPLLKNHTIQMKPSVSFREMKNQTGNNKTAYKEKINCPYGTVPVMRNTKEFNTNAQLFAEKYFHPLSADSPRTHIAGVKQHNGPFRAIEAKFKGYSQNIGRDQASYSQIYLGSGYYGEVNYISAGLMVNPGFFGDSRLWSFGFWKGKYAKGCYNTACPGFVQVSPVVPIVKPFDLQPGDPVWLHWSIHQDEQTGNWWILQLSPNEYIGYWPKELFHLMRDGAGMVGAGGVVQASPSGLSPPMGNGKFPGKGPLTSAMFSNVDVLNSKYEKRKINSFPMDTLLDSKCYRIKIGKRIKFYTTPLGFYFNYGGPGGLSCGV